MNLLTEIFKEAKEVYRFRWVTISHVRSTLLLRYRRSFLGFFWSLLGPILNYLVVGCVFYLLSRDAVPNYAVYMFSGTAIFNLISVITNASTQIMLVNESYIKKIYLPKSIFVLNSVAFETANFLFAFAALLILGFVLGKISLSWSLLSIPFVIACVLILVFGIASIFSVLTVFFRDFLHVMPILTQAAFFATPIMYPIGLIPPKYQIFIKLNPFYYVVNCFRAPLYDQTLASSRDYLVMVSVSIITFLVGFYVLKRNENKIIFKL